MHPTDDCGRQADFLIDRSLTYSAVRIYAYLLSRTDLEAERTSIESLMVASNTGRRMAYLAIKELEKKRLIRRMRSQDDRRRVFFEIAPQL